LILLLDIGLQGLKAQETIPAAGGNATGTGGSVSYSIGQIVYTTNTGTIGSVAQGVQQPYEFFTNEIDENKYISLKMTVYPNPTLASVTLSIEKQELENFSFQLYDFNGNLLLDHKISSTETSVPMENLSRATYILRVTNSNKVIKTFKIIKN
jgi:hypothetical protein